MSTECPACHGSTTSNARSCPFCGAPFPLPAAVTQDTPKPRRTRIGKPTKYRPQSFITLFMCWAVGAVLAFACSVAIPVVPLLMTDSEDNIGAASVISAAALLLITIGVAFITVILQWIFLYRSWAQIQDGFARTTPGMAIGLLLVPLFNFYWVFVAIRGLAVDANAFCVRHNFSAPPIPVPLATAYCILVLCMAIPYANIVAMVALFPISFILVLKIANTSAAIAEALAARAAAAPPQAAGEVASPEASTLMGG